MSASIRCYHCGRNLADDIQRGWVRWWIDRSRSGMAVVQQFDICCRGRCEESLSAEVEARAPGLFDHDGHMSWFTGKWAPMQQERLFAEYSWEPEPFALALTFFALAASLPDGEGPPMLV